MLKREYCRQLPLPDSLPLPLTQSASTHQPQQSSRVIDLGQHRGLPNDPALEVQSLSPVQQAAINDYNEKLRIYRLEQADLLARLNAWVEENIHDENQAEEKTDDNPMIVLGDDTPNDITNVPNDSAYLDVPNNESLEEFVKNENESRQVLVKAYDDKVGDLIVRKLEIKDDVETLLGENVVCYEDIIILIEIPANRNIGA